MRGLVFGGMVVYLCWPAPAAAQDYDEDDPIPYNWRDHDYQESGRHFGTPFYPRYENRNSPAVRRNDNRQPLRYPPAHEADRYSRNYGPPATTRYRPSYDDPDPYDNAYSRQGGSHYIAPDAENFRGGRYATDYPGFHGGWYGRDRRIRIRAGEYTAGDYANAFWEHQHRARNHPGEHTWRATFGSY